MLPFPGQRSPLPLPHGAGLLCSFHIRAVKMLGVIPGEQHSLGTDTPKAKSSVPAGAVQPLVPVTAPCLLLRHKTRVESSPGLNSGSSGSCFLASPCSQGTGAKPRALASSLASGGGGMEVFFQPPETWQGEQILPARRGVGWGAHVYSGRGRKGKKLHGNAGKYSYFSFSFVLKRPCGVGNA